MWPLKSFEKEVRNNNKTRNTNVYPSSFCQLLGGNLHLSFQVETPNSDGKFYQHDQATKPKGAKESVVSLGRTDRIGEGSVAALRKCGLDLVGVSYFTPFITGSR